MSRLYRPSERLVGGRNSPRGFKREWCMMAKTSPMEFIEQVRAEAAKVTWPTRKETLVTTAMVFVMVVLASIFFLLSDMIIQRLVQALLGLGR